jgi:hypothetical protein
MKVQAVTAFYDIGRETRGDGRKTSDYLRWLSGTLRLPLPFAVYVDPSQDISSVRTKPEDRIERLPWSGLMTDKWRPAVEEICAHPEKLPMAHDLTYKLPKYGLVNFAKLDLLAREADKAEYVLWVDAGASRCTKYDFAGLQFLERKVDELMKGADIALIANHRLYDYYKGRPHAPLPTRVEALVTGTVLLVRSSSAARLRDTLYQQIETEWLPNGLWDTEQTGLAELILKGRITAAIPQEDGSMLGILAAIFRRPGIAWMGLRWDTTRGIFKSDWDDYVWALRAVAIRAYRRRFVVKSKRRTVVTVLPEGNV